MTPIRILALSILAACAGDDGATSYTPTMSSTTRTAGQVMEPIAGQLPAWGVSCRDYSTEQPPEMEGYYPDEVCLMVEVTEMDGLLCLNWDLPCLDYQVGVRETVTLYWLE